jgi:GT2 family glycosyltransferase
VFVRAPLSGWTPGERAAFLSGAAPPPGRWLDEAITAVWPIRRVLLQTAASPSAAVVSPRLAPPPRPEASAAIIIPTRDQAGLLGRAVESLRRFPGTGRAEIVILDNGSVEAATLRLLETLAAAPDLRVLPHPGPFNFSLMCNEAAAATRADVLVFLNNDTEALASDWLDRLKAWALDPTVGAVGALLTYPDGRVQHGGVLLGMGESAGHFGAFAAPDDPGWAGRHAAVHEVAAVTGACLAVAREKFEAVGGFDAIDLPIELSDIDLCLRLAARGWTAIVDPGARLLHAESASRGNATFRRLDVYERERATFCRRWGAALRDDPYFHPGLSLYRWIEALG